MDSPFFYPQYYIYVIARKLKTRKTSENNPFSYLGPAEVVAYPVDVSQPIEEIEREMLERGRKLREALKAGILPPREMGWMCMNYCQYFGFCFSDYSPPVPGWVLEKLKE